MQRHVYLLRATASVLLRRHLTKLVAIPAVGLVLLCCVVIWLTKTYGEWWSLWLGVLLPLLILLGIIWAVVLYTSRLLAPRSLGRSDARDIAAFADQIAALSEQLSTPLPLIGLRILWDILVHKDVRTLQQFVANHATLREDYDALLEKMK